MLESQKRITIETAIALKLAANIMIFKAMIGPASFPDVIIPGRN